MDLSKDEQLKVDDTLKTNYEQTDVNKKKANTNLSLIGLILSVLSLICCGPIMVIPGLICSIIAINRNKKDRRAIIGICFSVTTILFWIALTIMVII